MTRESNSIARLIWPEVIINHCCKPSPPSKSKLIIRVGFADRVSFCRFIHPRRRKHSHLGRFAPRQCRINLWSVRGDSNSHALRHPLLRRTCLPIPCTDGLNFIRACRCPRTKQFDILLRKLGPVLWNRTTTFWASTRGATTTPTRDKLSGPSFTVTGPFHLCRRSGCLHFGFRSGSPFLRLS